MRTLKVVTAWVLLVAFGVSGCATPYPRTAADTTSEESTPEGCILGYTLGGAVLGGIVGGILGGKRGVGRGAAAGAVLGFAAAWGYCFDKFSRVRSQQVKGYQEAVREASYHPQYGSSVKITDYALDPARVRPGQTVNFNATYTILTPDEKKDISVTETRILKVYDPRKQEFVVIGRVDETLVVAPGQRRADGTFDVYQKVEPGRYMIDFMVTAEGRTDAAEMPLTVTKRMT